MRIANGRRLSRVLVVMLAACSMRADWTDVGGSQSPLTAEDCLEGTVGGKVPVCHLVVPGSYKLIPSSTKVCVKAHTGHAGDFVSADGLTCSAPPDPNAPVPPDPNTPEPPDPNAPAPPDPNAPVPPDPNAPAPPDPNAPVPPDPNTPTPDPNTPVPPDPNAPVPPDPNAPTPDPNGPLDPNVP